MGSKKRKKKSDEVVDVAPKIKAPAGTDDSARVVLVIGGEGHDNKRKIVSHKSTELLNLGTLTFSQGPSTTRGRQRFSVARLGKSMRALVVGGIGSGALNSTEVVDLDTLTCIKGPNLKSKRQLSAAVLLDEESGRVIVFGGSGEEALSSTEIFDPEANQFTPGPEMARRRTDVTAVKISENRILVIGGSNVEDGGALATTELLDLNTMRFASGPDMTMPRQGATAVALSGERVLVIGGIGPDQECSNTTEFIDVATGTSSTGPVMAQRRKNAATARISSDCVIVFGGYDCYGAKGKRHHATTEILDLNIGTWLSGPTMGSERAFSSAVVM